MAADVSQSIKDWSTTPGSNTPTGSTAISTNLDDNLRAIQSAVRADAAGTNTIASAATTDIGTLSEKYLSVTGTTTITSLGTSLGATGYGIVKILTFAGALTLTHSSSLDCIGSASITTAAGDRCAVQYSASGWTMLWYSRKTGQLVVGSPTFLDGTVSAPGISFASDTDTGFYRIGANSLGVAANGTNTATFASSGVTLASATGGTLTMTSTYSLTGGTNKDLSITGGADSSGAACGHLVLAGGGSSSSGASGNVVIKSGASSGAGMLGGSVLIGVGETPTDPGSGSDVVIQGPTKGAAGTLIDGYGQVFIRTGASQSGSTNNSRVVFSARAHASLTKDLCQIFGDSATWEWLASAGTPTVSGAGTGALINGSNYGVRIRFGSSPTTTITITMASRGGHSDPNYPVVSALYEGANSALTVRCTSSTYATVVLELSTAPSANEYLHVTFGYYR